MAAAGDFSFISDNMERTMLDDMYRAVTKAAGWDTLRNNDPGDGGFMFSKDEQICNLMNNVTVALDDSSAHSGASFAICMRTMQTIAREGWASWITARLAANK
jgi:hypothetical protein